MKRGELNKWTDELAETYGLSPQLTRAWLVDNGYDNRQVKPEPLRPRQVRRLVEFARI